MTPIRSNLPKRLLCALALATAHWAVAQTNDAIARIRDEGLNHSQVMATLSHLTEVIGPRLTGSPNLKRANDWTRDQLTSWGLCNAHLEAWGPFGRGWSLKRFSAQVIEPQAIPLIGYPNAWSPGFAQPLTADVVYFDAKSQSDLDKFKGQLNGKIVLAGAARELKTPFEPLAFRMNETNLLQLANANERSSTLLTGVVFPGRSSGGPVRRPPPPDAPEDSASATNAPGSGLGADSRGGGRGRFRPTGRYLSFLAREGAALIVNQSSAGDAGTFFVAAASVPGPERGGFGGFGSFSNTPRAWSTNAPVIPAQITIAAEDYNRLTRMIQQGEKLKMAVDLQVQFHDADLMAYNTIAEIPGGDLKDEIVMVGGHMDSWQSGTGATDNGAGVAAAMEVVRIIAALKLQPRRTIRVALWSGEEQGLLGSKAYVARHFGYYTNRASATPRLAPKDQAEGDTTVRPPATNSTPARRLVRHHDYEYLSAYFNLDNGAGKIRGIYLQGNEAARPLFRRWFEPFADLGADTVSLANTGATDHTAFEAIGLPGFQFIQDPLDYRARTHHSNEDVYDRVPPEDLKQAATIMAAIIYDAAMAEQKVPRKAAEER